LKSSTTLAGGVSRTTLEKKSRFADPVELKAPAPFSVTVSGITGAAILPSQTTNRLETLETDILYRYLSNELIYFYIFNFFKHQNLKINRFFKKLNLK
jgi:hypothetical protein